MKTQTLDNDQDAQSAFGNDADARFTQAGNVHAGYVDINIDAALQTEVQQTLGVLSSGGIDITTDDFIEFCKYYMRIRKDDTDVFTGFHDTFNIPWQELESMRTQLMPLFVKVRKILEGAKIAEDEPEIQEAAVQSMTRRFHETLQAVTAPLNHLRMLLSSNASLGTWLIAFRRRLSEEWRHALPAPETEDVFLHMIDLRKELDKEIESRYNDLLRIALQRIRALPYVQVQKIEWIHEDDKPFQSLKLEIRTTHETNWGKTKEQINALLLEIAPHIEFVVHDDQTKRSLDKREMLIEYKSHDLHRVRPQYT